MNIDDDEPPSLVDVNDTANESAEEPKPIRVPISIITGECMIDLNLRGLLL